MGTTRLEAGSRSARLRFSQRPAPVRIRATVATARRLIRLLGGPAGRARRLVTPRFFYRRIPPGIFSEDFASRLHSAIFNVPGQDAPNLSDSFGVFIGAVTARDDRFEAAPSRWELQQGTTPSVLLGELAAAMERRNKDHARDITTRREISNRAPERKICGGPYRRCVAASSGRAESFAAFG